MQKGIVFEIEKGKAIVMKNNGSFVTVSAHSHWKKGDLVTVKERTAAFKVLASTAACFFLFISLSVFGAGVYYNETAIISLDVNPSIELSVNQFDRVIDVRSLNDEGYHILEQINIKNKLFDNAVSALFVGGLGDYIPENPLVTFTVYSPDTQREKIMLKKLKNTADTYVSSHRADAEIEVLSVDENLVNEAHGHNVTAGKYAALQELQEVLPEMEIETYSHHSISYIKEQARIRGGAHNKTKASKNNKSTSNGNKHKYRGGHSSSHE